MSLVKEPEETFRETESFPSRWRLWAVILAALAILLLGFGLAVKEWRRHALEDQVAARQALQQRAQRLAAQLQADMRERHLLLRAVQIGAVQAVGDRPSDLGFAEAIHHFRADLMAVQFVGVVRVSPLLPKPSRVWLIPDSPAPPAVLDGLVEEIRRRSGQLDFMPIGHLLPPVVGSVSPTLMALPVVAGDRGLSIGLVDVGTWLEMRLSDVATSDLGLRVTTVDGSRELYRSESWDARAPPPWRANASLASPGWHIELGPRLGVPLGESGRAVAMAYVFGGALLAALVLFLGGQRAWLESRVAAVTHALEMNRARLQRALIVTREGAVEYVPEARSLYCSERLRVMLGLTRDATRLVDLVRLVSRRDRGRLLEALLSLEQGGRAIDETVQLRTPDGPDRWVRVRALAQLDERGKVERVTASVSDISGEVAQRLQQDSYREFLHNLMNAVPVPLSVKDAELRWIIVNQAYCEIERRPASDFLGRRSTDVVGDYLGGRLEAMDLAALDSDTPQVDNLWLERPDGTRNFVRITKIRCHGPDGRYLVLTSTEDLTQMQQKQEHEAALHTFYQTVFDALPHPVFIKDAQHRYVLTNRAHAESRDCSKEEIIGSTSFDHAPAEVAREIELAENQLFQGIAPPVMQHEYALLAPSGQVRHTIVRKVALRGMDGKPLLVGINTDITALRDMEDNLRAALHRFSILFELAPLGIVLFDHEGRLLDANPYFLQMTGYTRSQIQSLRHADLSSPQELASDRLQLEKMRAQGYCAPFPTHYRRRDGSEVPVMVSAVAVREGERLTQIWGLIQDTSERDAALAALRESEARWQFALEGAGDGVWDWDAERNTMYFSPRWKTMLGYSPQEIDDHPDAWRDRVHPDDLGRCLDAVERHVKGESDVYICEYRMRCKDGGYRWVLDRGKTIARDASGRVLRMIGTQTDISSRKQVEEELRQHRDRLAELVREQTGDLLRAKEAAERALEAKSLFLANMSHELRTPMHAVLSFAQLGEARVESVPASKVRDYFSRIHVAGLRLMHLLNDLLDLSKFEAGRMSISPEALDLGKVVREVALEYEAWLAAKRLSLELNIPAELPLAHADHARIGQVLRNLLSNAVKFTAEGKPVSISLLGISLSRGRRAGDAGAQPGIEIVVADNGPGVPEEELEAVFEKFVQSSVTRTGAGGTGLGLAICREIVNAHRGRIFARNRSGGGAEFVVQLPAMTKADENKLSLEMNN